jgi:hypothetical protein
MAKPGKNTVPHTPQLQQTIYGILTGYPERDNFYMVVTHDGERHQIQPDPTRSVEPRLWHDPHQAEAAAQHLRNSGLDAQVLGPYVTTFRKGDETHFDVTLPSLTWNNDRGKGTCAVPDTVDLICWTPAAFDKFIRPYYLNFYQNSPEAMEYVEDLRKRMLASSSKVLLHHWPTSPGTLEASEILEE